MPDDPRLKFVTLIPINLNDGSPVPSDLRDQILDEIYIRFGGFSVAGTARGAYPMMDGHRQDDTSLIVWIGIEDGQQGELKDYLAEVAVTLGQESMYLEQTVSTIEFIKPRVSGDQEL